VTRRPGSEKSLAFFIGREFRERTRIQKTFRRRFAQMVWLTQFENNRIALMFSGYSPKGG
jgi:hypothetical protein